MEPQEKTRPPVLITGSSGLIGTAVARLLARDYTVVGLDLDDPHPGALASHVRCDLTDDGDVARALDDVRSRYGSELASTIHLAAYYDFSGDDSPLYEELTVEGTRRLLRGLRARFACRQFVFSSTLLVMEPVEDGGGPITEESPTRAEWAYPESKLRAERVIHEERGEIHSVILRIAGVYDEGCHSLPLSQHIRRIHEKDFEGYLFPGDVQHGQPYIHLDDLAACFRAVVEQRGALAPEELFLVAEPDCVTHEELQNDLGELIHGRAWTTIRIPAAVAKAGAWVRDKLQDDGTFIKPWMIDLADDHYPVSVARAEARLSWKPRHRLRETLPLMVARMLEDPDAWYAGHGLRRKG